MKISRRGKWYRFVESGLGITLLPLSNEEKISLCQMFWGTVFSLLLPWAIGVLWIGLLGFMVWNKPLISLVAIGGTIVFVGAIIAAAMAHDKLKDGVVGETLYAIKHRVCPLIDLTD